MRLVIAPPLNRNRLILLVSILVLIVCAIAAPWADGQVYDAEDALTKLTLSAETDFDRYIPFQPIILKAKLTNPRNSDVKVKGHPFQEISCDETSITITYPDGEYSLSLARGCDSRREYIIESGQYEYLKVNLFYTMAYWGKQKRSGKEDYIQKGRYKVRIEVSDLDKKHKLARELSFEIVEPGNGLDIAALKRYKDIVAETMEKAQDNLWEEIGPCYIDSHYFDYFSKLVEFYEQFNLSTYGPYVAHVLGRTYKKGIYRLDENGKSTEKTQSFEIATWYLQNVVDNRNEYSYRYEAMHELAVCYRYTGRLEDAILLDEEVVSNAEDPVLIKDAKKTSGWYRERQKSLREKAEKEAAEAAEAPADE